MNDSSSTLNHPSGPLTRSLRRVTASKIFWHAAWDTFPGLKKHPGFPRLFWYLLFGTWHDKETSRLLLDSRLLAEMEGRDDQNTAAEKFLIRFKTEVLPRDARMTWTNSNPRKQKCRHLFELSFGFFDCIVEKEYRRHWHGQGRVFLDGSPFTKAKQREIKRKEKADATLLPGLCDDALIIQSYLNGLPQNLFTRKWEENGAATAIFAMDLPSRTKKMESVRKEQLRLLRNIESQPVPFYTASENGNTVRLFTRQTIANLKSEVREHLTSGWHEADLRCAQLAICARLWNVVEVQDFLATGKNFWDFLFEHIEVSQNDRANVKKSIKVGLYSICFGMEDNRLLGNIAYDLVKRGHSKTIARSFLKVPIIQVLLGARRRALSEIEEAGGALTPYNKWCPVTEERLARDVMAEIAQAWEMKLIYPAFELARSTDDFKITLFQFDGFSAHFTRREESWKKTIAQSVADEAAKHGIITNLEWKLK